MLDRDLDSETPDDLKDVRGVTKLMLAAFGKHGIRTVEDLADCSTDDLDGWHESEGVRMVKYPGILERARVTRQQCDTVIINARIKAGWITEPAGYALGSSPVPV